jgi:hypothetical protein
MESVGWEIRPAGWIVLFIVGVILIYYIVRWLWTALDKKQRQIN